MVKGIDSVKSFLSTFSEVLKTPYAELPKYESCKNYRWIHSVISSLIK